MRSFTIGVLLAVALALATFAPVASAGANITLYQDSQCTQVMGEGGELPGPSSTQCQDYSGPGSSGSGIFYCFNQNGYTNFTLKAWMTAPDCSGAADLSYTSYGRDGSCAVVVINFSGVSVPAFGKITCDGTLLSAEEAADRELFADTASAATRMARMAAVSMRQMAGRHGGGMLHKRLHK